MLQALELGYLVVVHDTQAVHERLALLRLLYLGLKDAVSDHCRANIEAQLAERVILLENRLRNRRYLLSPVALAAKRPAVWLVV